MLTSYQILLIEHVKKSIEYAQLEKSKLHSEILNLEGMSSNKIRHFLNNICSLEDGRYLEIGIWKGATFISALHQNQLKSAIAIDNWKQFSGTKKDFEHNVSQLSPATDYQLFESDCFNFDIQKISSKINLYFYDAGHTKKDQKLAFTHYHEIFDDTFIAIVDNYNWIQVQEATQEAFQELQYKKLFEKFLPAEKRADKDGWWTGLYVAVLSKTI